MTMKMETGSEPFIQAMHILFRKGSKVILISKAGEYWLTKRKKIRHTCRRQRPTGNSVRFIPIKRLTHQDIYNKDNKINITW
jgi:hypothetical protein